MNLRTIIATALMVSSIMFGNTAMAGATVSGKQPFAGYYALCGPAEAVYVEGWIETVTVTVFDQAGGSYDILKTQIHGTGTGLLTGTPYTFNDAFQRIIADPMGGGEERTTTRRIQLISHGPMFNAYIWFDLHFTIAPDGTLIVGWSVYEQDCF